jgi:hypothetical protein
MKRLIVPILTVLLTCGIAVAATRVLRHHQSPRPNSVGPDSDPIVKSTHSVNYKGVRFSFDTSIATEVKAVTLPAMTDGKPCDIVPEHPAFTLVGFPMPKGLDDRDPQIRIFPIAKFREAVAAASAEDSKHVVYPPNPTDWTVYFDEEVRTLKALIAEKPTRANVRAVIAKARRGGDCSQMPFLPMWEACQAFVAHLTYIDFKNGKGVFFLTQWDRETTQVTNEGLEYAFQGITNDGKYYVYAEFSVGAPFLPRGDESEVVAWAEKNYLLSHNSKEYQNYLRPVLAKLEALPSDKFKPSLGSLEQLIQSLEIQNK